MVHADIKSLNYLLTDAGVIKLADSGGSRLLEDPPPPFPIRVRVRPTPWKVPPFPIRVGVRPTSLEATPASFPPHPRWNP